MRVHLKKVVLCLLLSATLSAYAQPSLKTTVFRKGENGFDTYRIPAIIQTQDGALIAFAEARKNSGSDTGDIDLVAKRSLDGGQTWGSIITVWDDADNTCGNPCPVVDRESGKIILVTTWNKGSDSESEINTRKSEDTRRIFVQTSDDNGVTWTSATEITSSVKDPAWTWYATGPCHAVQLYNKENRGRLVIPCNHGVFGKGTRSHIIYSDDLGASWHLGGSLQKGNEATAAELKNGDIILNMRGPRTKGKGRTRENAGRLTSFSNDGGRNFQPAMQDNALTEPVCQGSIINYTKRGRPTETLFFSNPDNPEKRKDMTVKRSKDSGTTWEVAFRLGAAPAAYSDLVVMSNGDLGVLYETGKAKCYERIDFVRFNKKSIKKL